MNMRKWHETVAALAAYAGVSVEAIGRMTFLEASVLYAAMRAEVNNGA
jgi:hypothetical protein